MIDANGTSVGAIQFDGERFDRELQGGQFDREHSGWGQAPSALT